MLTKEQILLSRKQYSKKPMRQYIGFSFSSKHLYFYSTVMVLVPMFFISTVKILNKINII